MNSKSERSEAAETIQTILSGIVPVGLTIAWPTNKVEPGSGDRRTRIMGDTGFDLAKLKEWDPGDRVDGKASAKTGWRETLAALYEEPRDLTVWTIADNSPALIFGTQNMTERTLAATLLGRILGAASRDDRAGVITYDEQHLQQILPPKSASSQLLPALYSYLDPDESSFINNESSVSGLQQALLRLPLTERCLVFVISTFHNLTAEELQSLTTVGHVHDLVCLIIGDVRERELPEGFGLRELKDLRTGRSTTVWLSKRRRAQWAAEFDSERKRLRHSLGDAGAAVEEFNTSDGDEGIDLKLVPVLTGVRYQE
ncbi:MAG: hypothetical protein KGS72_12460 [Cyanobacteria bacterium REEB67]|nr:hypothetical protein [Cyanobacteria bacterium REEB67]